MRTASCDNFRSAFALKKDTYEPCEIHNRLGCLGGINVFLAICKLAHSWYSVTFVDALTREQSAAPDSSCNLWLGRCPACDAIVIVTVLLRPSNLRH